MSQPDEQLSESLECIGSYVERANFVHYIPSVVETWTISPGSGKERAPKKETVMVMMMRARVTRVSVASITRALIFHSLTAACPSSGDGSCPYGTFLTRIPTLWEQGSTFQLPHPSQQATAAAAVPVNPTRRSFSLARM
ncbi:hypothetical protein CBL_09292 [Carabus blaptoides fortunei]